MNEDLNELLEDQSSYNNYLKKNLKIIVICKTKNRRKYVDVSTNIDIPKDINYEFVYYFIDKSKKILDKNMKSKHFKVDKSLEIIRHEFKVYNDIIISSYYK